MGRESWERAEKLLFGHCAHCLGDEINPAQNLSVIQHTHGTNLQCTPCI